MTDTLIRPDGTRLVYNRLAPQAGHSAPGLVFLCGFGSDMEGSKALYLEALARERGQGFIRFDYSGHGLSDGFGSLGNGLVWIGCRGAGYPLIFEVQPRLPF